MDQIGRIQEQWTHWLYRRTPFWTACQETQDMLRAHGIQKVKRIPYGVYTRALPSLVNKPLNSPIRLIVVSRLAPNKRIDHAIQTVRCLKDRQIDAKLRIIGTGDSVPELKQCVNQLGLNDHVEFAGFLNEEQKDQSLQEAHLLLHTSVREGWGLNVIEANAMGTPSAVYPVAGLTESTLHDVTGRVSKQETPESLADEIQCMINNPDTYQQYRIKAWNRAKEFHWDAILPKACDWLESMALEGSPSA
jgi:glycosyltransferase involved in cell wall biosynthesis